jgi:carboxylesterase type B
VCVWLVVPVARLLPSIPLPLSLKMWPSIAAVLFAPVICYALPQAGSSQVETAQTTIGDVKGHLAEWPANSGVSEYLGIPYAEPPVGNLRFTAPKPYTGKGIVSGNSFGAGCIQGLDPTQAGVDIDDGVMGYGEGMGGIKNRNYSEDCLTLNIWTKPSSGEKGKAVLIWIYGGGKRVLLD